MKQVLLIVGLVMIGLTSCKKAELKKPVDVNFSFDLNSDSSGPLKINKGELNLGKFDVSGNRVEGDNIVFMRPFPDGLRTDMNGSGEVAELDYQIPQGEYTSLIIDLSLLADGGISPSLFVEGTYKPTNGPTKNIRFEFFDDLHFAIEGTNENGESTIIMDKKLGKKVDLDFNPLVWFETVSNTEFDVANEIEIDGQDVILISPSENTSLYTKVSERLTMGVKAIFK